MLDTNSTYTTGNIINNSTTSAQAVLQISRIEKQWMDICGRDLKDIMKEPFIADAKKVSIPSGSGNTTSLKSMNRIPTSTNPLEEGVTPKGQAYSFDAVSISVAEYGSFTAGTNQTDIVTSFGTLTTEIMKALKLSAEESKAKIVRDTIIAQGSEFYAGGKTSKEELAVGDIPTVVDLFTIRRLIIRNNGKLFSGNSVKVVADGEVSDILLMFDQVFAAYMEFGNTNELIKNSQVVNILGLHFVFLEYGNESDVTVNEYSEPTASGAVASRISPIIIYSKKSFAIAEQKGGMGINLIFKPVGSSGTYDPLNQRWTLGWYIGNFGVKVIRPRHVYVYWAAIEQTAGEEPFVRTVKTITP